MLRDANGTRMYVPKVGARVKFRHMGFYSARGIHTWAWMRVIGVVGRLISLQVLNGDKETGEQCACDVLELEQPIGWKPVYDVHMDLDKVEKFREWMETRGVRVKVDHCIGRGGGETFMPLDTDPAAAVTWGYEMADEVPAWECELVFRVWAYKREEFHMPKKLRKWEITEYKRAARAKGWELEYENYGANGGAWFRSKSVLMHDVDVNRPGQWRAIEEAREMLKAPQTGEDILWRLHDEMMADRSGDQEAEWERERIQLGEVIPRWVVYRAWSHLRGYLHAVPGGSQGGNSTWMFDPESKGDPVKRG